MPSTSAVRCCTPAVRPRVQCTRTWPAESVVTILSATVPLEGDSVTGTPTTWLPARSTTRISTGGRKTLPTDPSYFPVLAREALAAAPDTATAETAKRGTVRALPTCT